MGQLTGGLTFNPTTGLTSISDLHGLKRHTMRALMTWMMGRDKERDWKPGGSSTYADSDQSEMYRGGGLKQ